MGPLTGAHPLKFRLSKSPAGVRMMAKPAPPKSEWYGDVVFTAIVVAMIASAAFPPAARMRVPISEAILFSDTTAPPKSWVSCCDLDMTGRMKCSQEETGIFAR